MANRAVLRSGADNAEEGEAVENPRDAWESLEIPEYGPCYV